MTECSAGACGISCAGSCGCAEVPTGACSCGCYPGLLPEETMSPFNFTPVVFTRASSNPADVTYGLDDEIAIDAKDAVLASLAELLIPKDKQHTVAIPVGLIGKRISSQEKSTTLRKYFQALGALFIE